MESTDANRRIANIQRQIISLAKYSILLCSFIKSITTNNLGKLTISAGTTVDTIKLVPGSYKPSLVIEDGATVGKIIYNGNTYNVEQWKALVL